MKQELYFVQDKSGDNKNVIEVYPELPVRLTNGNFAGVDHPAISFFDPSEIANLFCGIVLTPGSYYKVTIEQVDI